MTDNSTIAQYLRDKAFADSAILLDDLQLGKLGIAMPSMVDRLKQRKSDWNWPAPNGSRLAMIKQVLGSKLAARNWVARRNVRQAELYWEGRSITPSVLSDLPPRFVVKPANAHSCKGVILFDRGRDLMARSPVSLAELPSAVEQARATDNLPPQTSWLIEELIADVDERYRIPRDFKIFVAGGHSFLFYVTDRNCPRALWSRSFFTRDWKRIQSPLIGAREDGPNFARPARLAELLAASDMMARELGIFIRLDFYLTAQGPVFGEFTPFPNHGLDNTTLGERTFSQLWGLFPDPPLNDAYLPGMSPANDEP